MLAAPDPLSADVAAPTGAVAPARAAAEPMRRCAATGRSAPAETMIRFVIAPDGTVVPDVARELPGRGLWLTAERAILAKAAGKAGFARWAGRAVVVPPDLADRVERLLVRRFLDGLGLARRAGEAVAGFEQTRAWLAARRVGLLIAALDGAAEGRRKLKALAGDVPEAVCVRSDELGAALGREPCVHVAVAPGRLARRLAVEVARLGGFRRAGETADGDDASSERSRTT